MLHTLLYFLALFSLSTSGIWAKLNHMPSSVLGFWRLLTAATLVSVWVFGIKKIPFPKFEKKILWILVSGFFFFAHLWTFKYAAKHTLIANMMILFSTNPVWTTLGSVILFKEKMTLRLWVAYFFAAAAVTTLVYNGFQFGGATYYGDICALLSAVFFSCYMLTGKSARLHYTNWVYASGQYIVCAILFLAVALINQEHFLGYDEMSWIAVAGLVLVPTFFGHFISTYLVGYLDLNLMSFGKLIEPVMAAGIAYFIFHEKLTEQAIVAFILTGLALLVLFVPNNFKPKIEDRP